MVTWKIGVVYLFLEEDVYLRSFLNEYGTVYLIFSL